MACALLAYSISLARILAYCAMFAAPFQKADLVAESTLVRVSIIAETRGVKGTIEINGRQIENYSPIIIQEFSSTGIVIDSSGNVAAYLGYRWADIRSRDPRVEVLAGDGQKWKGKLVGIDQSNGVAVIQTSGKLKKTPVCMECAIKDGITVMSPTVASPDRPKYQEAQVLSVGTDSGIPKQNNWIMAVNSPFPEIGQPLLTADHRVFGFIAGQDPEYMRMVVYPVDQMLSSAEKILKSGGDIRTGWLGVFLRDQQSAKEGGIVVQGIEPGSPAQKAGLLARDFLLKYNGREIQDTRHFIQLVESTPIGSKAGLEIARQGTPLSLTAVIEAREIPNHLGQLSLDLAGVPGSPLAEVVTDSELMAPRLRIGLEVVPLNPYLADALKMPGQTGLLVTDVVKKKPAEQAGVLVGDVIVAMDGYPIADARSFASFWQTHNLGAQLMLKVIRKGTEQIIAVQVPDINR